jgi:two-component system, OmpR family, sensor histidine kinase CiaH
MADPTKKQLRRATIVFWVLLVYIIAALAWWLISLEQQNKTIHSLRRSQVAATVKNADAAKEQVRVINERERRDSVKYIAEGIAFFLLIFVGAVYIYRLVRQQFQLQQQQQNFVMAVTHELKTPISVARLNLETLLKYELEKEKQRKMLDMTLQETLRLDELINNILISTQLDVEAYKAAKEELSLSDLVKDVVHQFEHRYHHRKVVPSIQEDVDLKGDPLLLKLLVSNLLENANKYSDRAAPIACKLVENEGFIELQVADEGLGIPDGEKEKVFDKFYRVGNEQTRTAKGTGLGLYICKKIAKSHDGDIALTDNTPRGSIFTVTFSA